MIAGLLRTFVVRGSLFVAHSEGGDLRALGHFTALAVSLIVEIHISFAIVGLLAPSRRILLA